MSGSMGNARGKMSALFAIKKYTASERMKIII